MRRLLLPKLGNQRRAIGAWVACLLLAGAAPASAAPLAMPASNAGVVDRVAVKKVPPKYPPGAERRGITGVVQLEFTVDGQGNVVAPRVVQGTPPGVFDSVALQAIAKWKYEPTGTETRAVQVNMKFELRD